MRLEDVATDAELWGLISRLQGIDGQRLSSRSVAALHRIIDQAQPSDFPDTDSQTRQAAWIRERIERDGA